jgi:hypothetical protein
MARNLYFSEKVRSEMDLYADLVIEALKIYGQDVYYLPRDLVNEDDLLGEDPTSRFPTSHKIEMYIENVEGFDGEGDLFTRFGVEIRDEATFVVARTRFAAQVRRPDNDITVDRPAEGDLIYLPLANKMFEIQHVEHEQPFYQIENLPVYKMRCTLFEYTGEDFDTSIEGIQDIEKTGSYQYKVCVTGTADAEATAELGFTTYDSPIGSVGGVKLITLDRGGAYYETAPSIRFVGGGDSSFALGDSATATAIFDATSGTVTGITLTDSGTNYATVPTIQFIGGNLGVDSDYRVGDTVAQQLSSTATISGEIQRIVLDSAGDSDMCLYLAHVGTDDGLYHTFTTGGELINTTRSGIIGRGLTIVGVTEDNKISETEQNDIFENLSDDFLDFSEDNPFGDPQ